MQGIIQLFPRRHKVEAETPPARRLRLAAAAFGFALGTLLAVATLFLPAGAQAKELATPTGPAVLTVIGAIEHTNRGPFDPFEDGFFKHHERQFEKAAAFDIPMLESLGLHEVTVSYSGWPATFRFEGPWLKDVLAAVGAAGKDIAAVALDGFSSEISAPDLAAYDWIVAVKRDGRYLDIGRRGPLWIVYARRDGKALTEDDENRWPWATFLIEVK